MGDILGVIEGRPPPLPSVLRLQSFWRGENKNNVQRKVYSSLEYCYCYYYFIHHKNYHSVFLTSISIPHFLIFNVSVIKRTVKSTCSSRDVHVHCWLSGGCMKTVPGDIIKYFETRFTVKGCT